VSLHLEHRSRSLLAALALALLAALAAAPPAPAAGETAAVVGLEVDGRADEPLGVDDRSPVLGWRVTGAPDGWAQSAYQVRAADGRAGLAAGRYLWDTGRVESARQNDVPYAGPPLRSRQQIAWQVRVWDTAGRASAWSRPSTWEMGLLARGDWGAARWIEHPDRTSGQPLPIFARAFGVDPHDEVTKARLYLSGLGIHVARLNGRPVTDEVLAPGNSNYQLSAEYRTYDVTRLVKRGPNTVGVELGHSTAFVSRSFTNPAVGRTRPYAWWQSVVKGNGTLTAPAAAGDSSVAVSSVAGYHVGGTVNVDTGDGGDRLESRRITAIGDTAITFEPPLSAAHDSGARVTGSGNPLASTDPSAGAAVTPRLIARLELTRADGSVQTIVTDRSWRTALGPTVTDNWFAGSDYDSRREQPGWSDPDADLTAAAARRDGSPTGWIDAGIAPPPNLTTELVWRAAEPVEVVDSFEPVAITQPRPGTWVFDFGQNFAGWPELHIDGSVPAGTTITM
jgi:alpha-L-rhamnosidase